MLDSADVERRIAWRKGLLVFNGQRLGDAAAEVNRYSDLRVTIDDPTLARAEFMGVFKLGDARAFANAAASAFNGEVHRRGNELVRSEEHTSALQSLMRISYAVFCLKKTIHSSSY